MRHVVVMSLTSSVGIMAIYLVDLLDIFFISLLGHKEMAAAAGYASTILFFVSAINIGISVASGALAAQYLGAGGVVNAREITTSATIISIIVGIVVPIILISNLSFCLGLIGAQGEVAEMSATYLKIILPATCLSGISMNLVAALRSFGDAKRAMYPALAGAAVNLVFDPILIFGLGLDLPGAAWATVMARMTTLIFAFQFALKAETVSKPDVQSTIRHLRDIVRYALSAVLASVAAPVGLAILTRYMSKFGSEAVAATAVVGRLSPVVFSIVNALSGAVGPIIGQNHGAGYHDRVRSAYYSALKFLAVYVSIVTVLLFILRETIADIFGVHGLTRDLLYLYCGPIATVAFFNGTLFISSAAFNNLGYPQYSPWLNWAKNTIGLLPIIAIGAHFFGVYGIPFGVLVSAIIFAVISVLLTERVLNSKTQVKTSEQAKMDGSAEHAHRSINHTEPVHT